MWRGWVNMYNWTGLSQSNCSGTTSSPGRYFCVFWLLLGIVFLLLIPLSSFSCHSSIFNIFLSFQYQWLLNHMVRFFYNLSTLSADFFPPCFNFSSYVLIDMKWIIRARFFTVSFPVFWEKVSDFREKNRFVLLPAQSGFSRHVISL